MLNCEVLNRKITSNKIKHLLVENQSKKLETFDSNIFVVKVILKMMYSKLFSISTSFKVFYWITKWKSKGLSNGSLEIVFATSNTLTPSVNCYGDKVRLGFTGRVL